MPSRCKADRIATHSKEIWGIPYPHLSPLMHRVPLPLPSKKTDKLSLTNPRDAMYHGERAANK